MKKILLVKVLLLIRIFIYSQNTNGIDSCLSLTFSIIISGKEVLIQPVVNLRQCNGLFQIYKKNRFDQEFVKDCDGKIFVEKLIGGFWVAQTMWKLPGMYYDDSLDVRRTLLQGSNSLDNFKITDLMPFEKGKYHLRIRLDYFHEDEKKTFESEDIEFDLKKTYTLFVN